MQQSQLQQILKADPDKLKYDLYQELRDLGATFATTNMDIYLSKHFNETRIVKNPDAFNKDSIDTNKVFYLHGHQSDGNTTVLTVEEYIQRYNHPKFKNFIGSLLTDPKYTILFIGYGLNEFELLDYMVSKVGMTNTGQNKEWRHIILLPFFEHQEELANLLQDAYFDCLGIEIVAFAKDNSGFTFLYDIVKKWRTEMFETTKMVSDAFKEIDEIGV